MTMAKLKSCLDVYFNRIGSSEDAFEVVLIAQEPRFPEVLA